MASVTRTRTSTGETRWRARWRDPGGKSREAWFARRVDAERHLTTVEHQKLTGAYVDRTAGHATVAEVAEEWLAAQTFDPSSRQTIESRLRVHVLPTFGPMRVAQVRPSTVQAWLRAKQGTHQPRSVQSMLAVLSSVLAAAVEDGRIARNPCDSTAVKAPAVPRQLVVPWTAAQVAAVLSAHEVEWRTAAALAGMAGLRQGEVFGLRVEDVDFLRRTIHVRQQVRRIGTRIELAPPKRGKTRDVPLSDLLGYELAEHIRRAGITDGLLWRGDDGGPINRDDYRRDVWYPALLSAGIERTRANGMHALRHYYASVLLDQGVSIRALADYLGHSDPAFTLRVYAHLMPGNDDRARDAIDAAFAGARGALVGLGASRE